MTESKNRDLTVVYGAWFVDAVLLKEANTLIEHQAEAPSEREGYIYDHA